jgi:hypothetical protein
MTPPEPPAPPTPVYSSITGGLLSLEWLKPLDTGGYDAPLTDENGRIIHFGDGVPDITEYRVFSKSNSVTDWMEAYRGPDIQTRVGRLYQQTLYEMRVRALNPVSACVVATGNDRLPGVKDPESACSTGMYQRTTKATIPAAPLEVHCREDEITGGKIVLEIVDPEDKGGVDLSSYRFEMLNSSLSRWPQWFVESIPEEEIRPHREHGNVFSVYRLKSSSSYQFRVMGVNSVGVGPASSEVTCVTSPTTAPGKARPPWQPTKKWKSCRCYGRISNIAIH